MSKKSFFEESQYIWLDGKLIPWSEGTIHVTHGHIFAHAIFEGIRAYWNDGSTALTGWQIIHTSATNTITLKGFTQLQSAHKN